MTIHTAPAHNPKCSLLAGILRCPASIRAANDNAPVRGKEAPSDVMLRAALRHFAQHGLGAARAARKQAEEAFFAGDRQSYDWWLGITRTLDRRLATESERARAALSVVPGGAEPIKGNP